MVGPHPCFPWPLWWVARVLRQPMYMSVYNASVCTYWIITYQHYLHVAGQGHPSINPAAKSKNISFCGEIMKLGTLIMDSCGIIFRLGPNSETPLVAAILNFNMAAIFDIILLITLKLRQTEMRFQCLPPHFRGQGIQ